MTTHGFSKEYKVTVDASDVGVGAIFQFVFKTLTKSSKNNPQLKKKLLALLKQLWCTFHPFVMLTDHNTVIFLGKMQNKNHRLTRWGFMLQEYNLIITHIKCKDNFIINVLSRVG